MNRRLASALELVRPGPDALRWLGLIVATLRDEDALRPITVVVPNYNAGRFALRYLARSGGAVNVRVMRLVELASQVVGPAGRKPFLSPVQESAAIRSAIREAGGPLRQLMDHRSLQQALQRLFREYRQLDIDVDTLDQQQLSETALASLDVYRAFRRLTDGYPDRTAVRDAAVHLLQDPGHLGQLQEEIGALVLYLPVRLDPTDIRLLAAAARLVPLGAAFPLLDDVEDAVNQHTRSETAALAEALGCGAAEVFPGTDETRMRHQIQMIRAPDPGEEVREMVRRVTADLDEGVPLNRIAVLYRQFDPYADLVRETFDLAELPWSGLEGRPLTETPSGCALIALLRLVEHQFARDAVLAWVDARPNAAGLSGLPASAWDRISRTAKVVRGSDQWVSRLARFAATSDEGAERCETDGSTALAGMLRREAAGARTMADVVSRLALALQPPSNLSNWIELSAWAQRLWAEFGARAGGQQENDDAAASSIEAALLELAEADRFDPDGEVSLPRFVETLQAELMERTVPEGRLGQGLLVGPVQSVMGLAFDRIYILGLIEGSFPPSPPADPFFLVEEQDPTGRRQRQRASERRAFLTALASADGGRVTLSAPESTGGRAAYPSHWLLESASELLRDEGVESFLDGAAFGGLSEAAHPWIHVVRSAQDGVERAVAYADLEDRRLAEAAAWRQAGRPLRSHALATRPELPIGLGLEVAEARRSDRFTAYDGNLAELASSSTRLGRLFNGISFASASSMQSWAHCPFRYFLDRVLYVQPTKRPEDEWRIDALEQGTLVHLILERFLHQLAKNGRPAVGESYTRSDFEALEALAEERFRDIEGRGVSGHPLVWETTRKQILGDLRTFLAEDEQWRREGGWHSIAFEQAFGSNTSESWAPVLMQAGGGTLRMRGYIDRVDLSADGKRAYIFDYKTGGFAGYRGMDADPALAGTEVQLALYTRAAREALGEGVQVGGAYWFVSSRGEFRRIGLPDEPERVQARLQEVLDLVAQGIRGGVFPPVPGDEDRDKFANCRYCAYDRVCVTGRDQQWERKQADGGSLYLSLTPS